MEVSCRTNLPSFTCFVSLFEMGIVLCRVVAILLVTVLLVVLLVAMLPVVVLLPGSRDLLALAFPGASSTGVYPVPVLRMQCSKHY